MVSSFCSAALLPSCYREQKQQTGLHNWVAEFISIDCGLTETKSYLNTLENLTYVSDDGFIDSGVNFQIHSTKLERATNEVYYTGRSFLTYPRNCYQLPATVGSKYIVRAAFLYGNYDGLNRPPSFDLYLGVDLWDTVNLTENNTPFRTELVVQAKASFLYVCLVNTGRGTPFISALVLQILPQNVYAPANSSLSLALRTFKRVDVGAMPDAGYPFDRLWQPDYDGYGTPYNTSETVTEPGDLISGMPSVVMQTAVYSREEIKVNWTGGVDDMFYLYLEFADVVRPANGQPRQMNIQMNGQEWRNVTVDYLKSSVLYSITPLKASQYSFSIRSVNVSDERGAVLNSFEVYTALTFNGSATHSEDVSALQDIKGFYNLTKNWMGDPCLPVSPWDGLTCDNASTPRILTLDLSNCELNGTIAEQISKLTALKTLNLSRNNLNGSVPPFLGDLQNLSNIDLSSNSLSGPIPPSLQKKMKNRKFMLRIEGNPKICVENQCERDHGEKRWKNTFLIFIMVSLILATIVIIVIKQRKRADNKATIGSLLQPHESGKSVIFTYSEVVEMTNDFEKVIGKGGTGTVFYGCLKDGREVAVKKVSSRFLERGIKEFVAEVKMLMQVHHKHLIPFIGYCAEENEMILIYEYMSKGNLQKQLSADALNWRQRLQIALDAAIGLEYLHSRCTPAFIHRDVKSSNILINENFQAKIADFGLSKCVVSDEITHISTAIAGTPGYLDPEYCYTNNVTVKSDVYGFGVVLLELITGQTAISTDVEGQRVPLVQLVRPELKRGDIKNIIDPKLQGQYDMSSIQKVADLAMACTEEKSIGRPTMTEVVAELREAMEAETPIERNGNGRMGASSPSSLSFSEISLNVSSISDVGSSFHPSVR